MRGTQTRVTDDVGVRRAVVKAGMTLAPVVHAVLDRDVIDVDELYPSDDEEC